MKSKFLTGVITTLLILSSTMQGGAVFAAELPKYQLELDAIQPLQEKQLGNKSIHFELDFSSLDVVVDNDDVKLVDNPSKLKESLKALNSPKISNETLIANARKDFTKQQTNKYLKDKYFKQNLISLVNDLKSKNKNLIQVGITMATKDVMENKSSEEINKIFNTTNTDKSSSKAFMTSSYDGGSTYNSDRSCQLWVSVSNSGYSDLWLQSNLRWDGTQKTGGRDFIGIEWDSNWLLKTNSDSFTPMVKPSAYNATKMTSPMRAGSNGKNLVYSFNEGFAAATSAQSWAVSGIYMGATLQSGPTGYQTFRAQYTHTYSSASYGCTLNSSGPGFTVSPSSSQYTLVSYVTPNICRQV